MVKSGQLEPGAHLPSEADLVSQHRVQRMGFWWWSNRHVKAVGCGANPPPAPETETLPTARVELLVFVPEG